MWRFIDSGESDAFSNMAVDEAILWARINNMVPDTLRVYTWLPSAVSIGFFQSLNLEVDLEECKRSGFDVVRRITGGGAVYHESGGELTYSLIVGEESLKTVKHFDDIQSSYAVICQGLLEGFSKLGISAQFKPINDIIVNGKKISGNAQTRRNGVILQHGTILLNTDIPTMFKVLKVSKEKISDKAIKAVEARVTTIFKEGKDGINLVDVKKSLHDGFSEALNVQFDDARLTNIESNKAVEYRERFSSPNWINQR